jgi:hypothetical protein
MTDDSRDFRFRGQVCTGFAAIVDAGQAPVEKPVAAVDWIW